MRQYEKNRLIYFVKGTVSTLLISLLEMPITLKTLNELMSC